MLPDSTYLRDISARLAQAATDLENARSAQIAAELDNRTQLERAIDVVAYWASRGVPDFDALNRARRATGMDAFQLKKAWAVHRRLREARVLHAKRLMVQMLTDSAWSNQDIADLLGVHVKHVPRMKKALEPENADRCGI